MLLYLLLLRIESCVDRIEYNASTEYRIRADQHKCGACQQSIRQHYNAADQ